MKKYIALLIAALIALSAFALADVDTSDWVKTDIADSEFTVLLPRDMKPVDMERTDDEGWTGKDAILSDLGNENLRIEISKFAENPSIKDLEKHIEEKKIFDEVMINDEGYLTCMGADDSVTAIAFKAPNDFCYMLTFYPFGNDEAHEFDSSVGCEMAQLIADSLKPKTVD